MNLKTISKVYADGRVQLPKKIRKELGIKNGNFVTVECTDEKIIIEKYGSNKKCYKCGTNKELIKVDDVYICKECLKHLIEKIGGQA